MTIEEKFIRDVQESYYPQLSNAVARHFAQLWIDGDSPEYRMYKLGYAAIGAWDTNESVIVFDSKCSK